MDHVVLIRHKVLQEKKSQRSVAEELGISRNTVKKYLKDSETDSGGKEFSSQTGVGESGAADRGVVRGVED